MAFQTNTFVNGEWVHQELNVNDVLNHHNQKDRPEPEEEVEQAPVLGLLSQTVIQSPLAHWILPARMRSMVNNDVAFIGDGFVQIKELREDGVLWDVAYEDNFGSRIRNARIGGSTEDFEKDLALHNGAHLKSEDGDVEMENGYDHVHQRDIKPAPQYIILQLETNDTVFLTLQRNTLGNEWKFTSSRHRLSKSMHKLQPGIHLAVDPSSRYMAIGSSEDSFAIYALNSRAEIIKQKRHVASEKYIFFHGVILKMEFLYPSTKSDSDADDETATISHDHDQILLLILYVNKGRTYMRLYEWESGDDLARIRPHGRKGHLLAEARQLPLLLIPLTLGSSFILVSEHSLSVCQRLLEGCPEFTDIPHEVDAPTSFHHGLGAPLWTAWTRPPREGGRVPNYFTQKDVLYIVREDGRVRCLELDKDDLIECDMTVGEFNSNCGSALASLSYLSPYDGMKSGDFLITGGDAGAGGAYLIKARATPDFLHHIQNWSPVHDFITTSKYQDEEKSVESLSSRFQSQHLRGPDTLYACTGKESSGSIIEFRHGFEALIGFDMSYNSEITNVWSLPPDPDRSDSDNGPMLLLSLPHCSAIVQLSSNLSDVTELSDDNTKFDLLHRTIATGLHGSLRIQVTDKSVVFCDGPNVHIQEGDDLLSVHDGEQLIGRGTELITAVIWKDSVLFTTYIGSNTFLRILKPRDSKIGTHDEEWEPVATTKIQTLGISSNRITALAMCLIMNEPCVIVAKWTDNNIVLDFMPLSNIMKGGNIGFNGPEGVYLDELVSLSTCRTHDRTLFLVGGTRNGVIITWHIHLDGLKTLSLVCDRVGDTPVVIIENPQPSPDDNASFYATCDSKMFAIVLQQREGNLDQDRISRRRIGQIFLTDAQNPALQSPGVSSVARFCPKPLGGLDDTIAVAAGSRLLLAGLSLQAKTIPRRVPVGGTPSRMIHSHHLGVLIVAGSRDHKSTLFFIDPETGKDVSRAVDKNNKYVTHISGLGEQGDRIFRVLEWSFTKNDEKFYYIVVVTHTKRVLIISMEKEQIFSESSVPHEEMDGAEADYTSMPNFRIKYWTRTQLRCEASVYSIVGTPVGLFYCSGNIVHFAQVDTKEKKMKTLAKYELPSPALHLYTLANSNGKSQLFALTKSHSLVILEIHNCLTPPDITAGEVVFIRTHGDKVTRNSLHHRVLASPTAPPLHLLSDKDCSVVGLYATQNTRADTLETVFEAQLPHSILRLRYGNCSPTWDPSWNRRIVAPIDVRIATDDERTFISTSYPEIFGMSIDGSLSHFSIISQPMWAFLRFIVNMALQSPSVCELTHTETNYALLEPCLEPKSMMHIDGDILRRIVKTRELGKLVNLHIGQEDEILTRLAQLYHELCISIFDGWEGTAPNKNLVTELAYRVMEQLLRPMF